MKIKNYNNSKKHFTQFLEKHTDSGQYLKTWYETASHSGWKSPNEVKDTYASANILKNGRIVFNIEGNSYRLVVRFNFEKQWAFIRFIGIHAEYDKIDADNI